MNESESPIKSATDFQKTPRGWAKRWASEMVAADKRVRKWLNNCSKIQGIFADRRPLDVGTDFQQNREAFRVNLFNSNINTLRDMLNGATPKIDVSRKHADSDDDAARVASMILSRMLNDCVEASGDDYLSTLQHALDNKLLAGFGIGRVVYEVETEENEIEEQTDDFGNVIVEASTETELVSESAPTRFIHYRDFRWGYCRTWSECPWIGFRSYLTHDEATKRFGEEKADWLQYNSSNPDRDDDTLTDEQQADAWDRAEVWEIWNKSDRRVYWWHKGCDRILDQKDDPLELFGFWPTPEPMLSNCIDDILLPQPDYIIAQDLYQEVDILQTRISILTKAVRAVGVYDAEQDGVKRMMQEGVENDLLPVENWAMFGEKGGLKGVIDWFPVQDIVFALEKLVAQRSDAMSLLYEVTGMADIMRGGAGPDRETGIANQNRKQFASVRVQGKQDDLARFASDLMRLKAEVISRHFSPKTIIDQSNVDKSKDAQQPELIQQAVELIKQPQEAAWRIKVRPETLAMVDYDRMKQERSEFIQAIGFFLQSAQPIASEFPEATPALLEMLKWTCAGFKGSQEIEGVLDRAIDQMQESAKKGKDNKEPSPEMLKMQADQQKHQQAMELLQAKHQAAMELETAKINGNLKELFAELRKELDVIRAQTRGAIVQEAAQSDAAMAQDDHETDNQLRLERAKASGE